jgi:Fe-S oxidoreductase
MERSLPDRLGLASQHRVFGPLDQRRQAPAEAGSRDRDQKKLEEIQRTGVKILVTSCQQCVRTIKGRARKQKMDLEVMDLTELILKAMA